MEEKQRLRQFHRRLRDEMGQEEIQQKSREICRRLLLSDWYASCRTIYGYYPLGAEVDCRGFLRQALADGKAVALPRTGRDCRMEFYRIFSFEQVAEGRFHVMEPLAECPPVAGQQGVVLVPGAVFDREGNRYGYGKGYYDRYFARFPGLRRMAVAYEHQIEPRITVFETDRSMERIYTEQQVLKV